MPLSHLGGLFISCSLPSMKKYTNLRVRQSATGILFSCFCCLATNKNNNHNNKKCNKKNIGRPAQSLISRRHYISAEEVSYLLALDNDGAARRTMTINPNNRHIQSLGWETVESDTAGRRIVSSAQHPRLSLQRQCSVFVATGTQKLYPKQTTMQRMPHQK